MQVLKASTETVQSGSGLAGVLVNLLNGGQSPPDFAIDKPHQFITGAVEA